MEAVTVVAAALSLAAAAAKLRGALRAGPERTTMLFFAAALAAFGGAVGIPANIVLFPGQPYLVPWIAHCCAMLGGACLHTVAVRIAGGPTPKPLLAMGIVLTAAVSIATAASTNPSVQVPGATVADGDVLQAIATLVYLAYLLWALTRSHTLIGRYARREDTGVLLHRSLTLTTSGVAVGVLWVLWAVYALLSVWLGWNGVASVEKVFSAAAEGLGGLALLLLTIGATYTSWAAPMTRAFTAPLARRLFRQLEPLHQAVIDVMPQLALSDRDQQTDRMRLYRQVIEIRDAQMRLRAHVHPEVAHLVALESNKQARHGRAGIWISGGESWNAIREAAELATAIDGYRHGRRYDRAEDVREPDHCLERQRTTLAEARHLVRVCRAFTDNVLVREIRRTLCRASEVRTQPPGWRPRAHS
ncbi:MAB_1171c family putative transporter [Amycolatopsis azurea]|uniref:MAB_1171c family putative transporter n=1 Tax=Amycolatopsis azurea TaxID=36819 RepID=UPI0037F8C255